MITVSYSWQEYPSEVISHTLFITVVEIILTKEQWVVDSTQLWLEVLVSWQYLDLSEYLLRMIIKGILQKRLPWDKEMTIIVLVQQQQYKQSALCSILQNFLNCSIWKRVKVSELQIILSDSLMELFLLEVEKFCSAWVTHN